MHPTVYNWFEYSSSKMFDFMHFQTNVKMQMVYVIISRDLHFDEISINYFIYNSYKCIL